MIAPRHRTTAEIDGYLRVAESKCIVDNDISEYVWLVAGVCSKDSLSSIPGAAENHKTRVQKGLGDVPPALRNFLRYGNSHTGTHTNWAHTDSKTPWI